MRQEWALDPYGKPRDIAHGEEPIRQAAADSVRPRDRLDRLQTRGMDLQTCVDHTKATVAGFQSVLDSLAGVHQTLWTIALQCSCWVSATPEPSATK
jgi:hypothetical protein